MEREREGGREGREGGREGREGGREVEGEKGRWRGRECHAVYVSSCEHTVHRLHQRSITVEQRERDLSFTLPVNLLPLYWSP